MEAVGLRFGNCNNGDHDGLRALNLNNSATNASWNTGASFIYLIWSINPNADPVPTPLAVEIPLIRDYSLGEW